MLHRVLLSTMHQYLSCNIKHNLTDRLYVSELGANKWERLWIYSLIFSSALLLYFSTWVKQYTWTVHHILYAHCMIYGTVLGLNIHVLCDIMPCHCACSAWCLVPLAQWHTASHHVVPDVWCHSPNDIQHHITQDTASNNATIRTLQLAVSHMSVRYMTLHKTMWRS
jgi:hypothetical protein